MALLGIVTGIRLAAGFAPTKFGVTKLSYSMLQNMSECKEEECALPDDFFDVAITSEKSSEKSAILRSTVLSNVQGKTILLGDTMGPDKSVVVFLRHLG